MPSDHAVRLRAVLSDLEEGHISTAAAAHAVRAMKFPVPRQKTSWQLAQEASLPDLPPPAEGAFFEVSQAYSEGRITRTQYEALAQAAAQAIKDHAAHQDGEDHGEDDAGVTGPGSPDPDEMA